MNAKKHTINALERLAKSGDGLSRAELSREKEIGGGSVLTKDLRELEECGFIRKYSNFTRGEVEYFYQLIEPYTNNDFVNVRKRYA